MALKIILPQAEFESLSDELKKEYKPREGSQGEFILDTIAVGGLNVENVTGLKNALSQTRTERDTAMSKLKAFEGLDPVVAREALTKVEEIGRMTPNDKVEAQIKAQKDQLQKIHSEEIGKHTKHNELLTTQLTKLLVDNAAMDALTRAKAKTALLMPHITSQVRTRMTEDGRFLVEVIDKSGNVRVGDSNGNPMTIPQLVDEMAKDDLYAAAFPGTGQSGTGQSGSTTPSPTGAGTGGNKVIKIKRSDQQAINDNWQKIADGSAVVED